MRLIDADIFASVLDFADADVCEEFPDGYCEFGFSREKIRELLRDIPSVDAVPVVRCRDCRYRGMIYCPEVHETMGNGLIDYTSDEAYCWRWRPKEYTNAT